MTASQELISIAGKLDDVAKLVDAPELKGPIARFRAQIQTIDASHSGGHNGDETDLYYKDFEIPPNRNNLVEELVNGLDGTVYGIKIKEGWKERTFDEVKSRVYGNLVVEPNSFFSSLAKAPKEVKFAREECASIFVAVGLSAPLDALLTSLKTSIDTIRAPNKDEWARHLCSGVRDAQSAPNHIALRAIIEAQISEFKLCADLAELCRRAARHLERARPSAAVPASEIPGPAKREKYVFIGHGRSLLWRELKDFLQDRLGLPWDEFNREPVAGYSTTERLSAMLNDATFALMVMTAEDETAEGKWQARMNVIHEVGLFQGKLGFRRAIVLLESGCEEFSNIRGLTHIMFEKGRISSAFEEIRKVLEREKLITT
jgi:predicted nucleotide-binding protein